MSVEVDPKIIVVLRGSSLHRSLEASSSNIESTLPKMTPNSTSKISLISSIYRMKLWIFIGFRRQQTSIFSRRSSSHQKRSNFLPATNCCRLLWVSTDAVAGELINIFDWLPERTEIFSIFCRFLSRSFRIKIRNPDWLLSITFGNSSRSVQWKSVIEKRKISIQFGAIVGLVSVGVS